MIWLKKKKIEWQRFIDGYYDGIPIDYESIKDCHYDLSDDPDFDFSQKLGISDYLYLDIGLDIRWLKRYNPKGHVIF